MADKKSNLSFNHDFENNIIRDALLEIGDTEALQLFEEEQAEMEKKAKAELEAMWKRGELLVKPDFIKD